MYFNSDYEKCSFFLGKEKHPQKIHWRQLDRADHSTKKVAKDFRYNVLSKLKQSVFYKWTSGGLLLLYPHHHLYLGFLPTLRWKKWLISIFLTTQRSMGLILFTLSYRILPTGNPKQITSQMLECNHCWLSCPSLCMDIDCDGQMADQKSPYDGKQPFSVWLLKKECLPVAIHWLYARDSKQVCMLQYRILECSIHIVILLLHLKVRYKACKGSVGKSVCCQAWWEPYG